MTITELKTHLHSRSELNVLIALPDGGRVPAHYHITEVGHVAKRFIDCGGTVRTSETCVLQAYFGSPKDDGHRLSAGKLAHILELAKPILTSGDLSVEVEYEDRVISQFPVTGFVQEGGSVVLEVGLKHTDCLAKDRCGIAEAGDEADAGGCCTTAVTPGRCC